MCKNSCSTIVNQVLLVIIIILCIHAHTLVVHVRIIKCVCMLSKALPVYITYGLEANG